MAYHHGRVPSIEERKNWLGLSEETILVSAIGHRNNRGVESCQLPTPKKPKFSSRPKLSQASARYKARQRRMADKPPIAPKPDVLKSLPPAPKPRKRTGVPVKPVPYKMHKEIKEKAITTFKSDQPIAARLLPTEPHQKPQRPPRKKGKPPSDFYSPPQSPKSPIQYAIPEVPVKVPLLVESRPRLDTPQEPPDPEAVANNIPQVNSPKRPRRSKPAPSTINSRPRLGTPAVPPEPTLIRQRAVEHTNGDCNSGLLMEPVTDDGALYLEAYGHVAEDQLEVEYSTIPERRVIPTRSDSSGVSSHSPTPSIPTPPIPTPPIPTQHSPTPPIPTHHSPTPPIPTHHSPIPSIPTPPIPTPPIPIPHSPTPPLPADSEYSVTSHVVESRKKQFRTPPPLPHTPSDVTAMEGTGAEEYALLDRPDKPDRLVSSPVPPAQNYSSLDIPESEYSVTSHVIESRKKRFRTPPPLPHTPSDVTAMEGTGAEEYALLDRPDKPDRLVPSPIPPAQNYSSESQTGFPGQKPTHQQEYSELEIPSDPTHHATLVAPEGYEVLQPEFGRKVPRLAESNSVEEDHQNSFAQPTVVEPGTPKAKARKASLKLKSGELKLQESRDRSALPTYNNSEMDYQPAAKPVSFQRPPPPKPRHQRTHKPHTNGTESQSQRVCCTPPSDEPTLEEVGYETWRTFSPPPGGSKWEGFEESMGEQQEKAKNVEDQDGSTSEELVITSPKCVVDIDHLVAVHHALRSGGHADSRRYENQKIVDTFRHSGSSVEAESKVGNAEIDSQMDVMQSNAPGAVNTLEEVDLSTVEHSSTVDALGYCEVDVVENLVTEIQNPMSYAKDEVNLFTVEQSALVVDAHSYSELEVTDQIVPEKKPELMPREQDMVGLSSVKCSPVVVDARGYCDLDVPDPIPPQVKPKPVPQARETVDSSAIEHSPVFVDARGYCDIDVPDVPPQVKPKLVPQARETVDSSAIEHSPVFVDARGYCDIDVPDVPPQVKPKPVPQAHREVESSTVGHSPITDARGYCELDVPDTPPQVKPKPVPHEVVDSSTVERSPLDTDARGYCELDVPEPCPVVADAREYSEIDIQVLPKPKPRQRSRKVRSGSRGDSVSSETETPPSPLASQTSKSPEQANSKPQQILEKQHRKETPSEAKGSPKVSSDRKVLGPPRRKAPPPPIKVPPSSRHLPPLPRLPSQHSQTASTEASAMATTTAKPSEPISSSNVEELKKMLSIPKPLNPVQLGADPQKGKGGGRFSRAKSRSIHVARPTPKSKVPASPREDTDVDTSSKDQSPGVGRRLKGWFKKSRDREDPVTLLSVTVKTQSLPREGYLPQVRTAADEDSGIYSTIPEPLKEVLSPEMDEDMYTVVDLPVRKKEAQGLAMRRSASNEHLYDSTEYDKAVGGSGARSASNSPLVQHRTQDQFSRSLPPAHPIATLPRRRKTPKKKPPNVDAGQLYATVTKPKKPKDKEQLPPFVGANPHTKGKTPPVVATKPQTKVKTKVRPLPAVGAAVQAEDKLQDQLAKSGSVDEHAVEEFVITSVDEKFGRVASKDGDTCIPSSEIVHTVSVGGEQYAVVNVKPKLRSKPDKGLADDIEPQVDLPAAYGNDTTKDQEPAQDTAKDGGQNETPLQGTGCKPAASSPPQVVGQPSKPLRSPRNPPPKPIPYNRDSHHGDSSKTLESTEAPPVPTSDRPKPSRTIATSTTTLEGKITKVGFLGEVFHPPSHPPPAPPKHPTTPLPPLPTSPTPTSPPPFHPQLSPSERARIARLSSAGPPSFPPPPPPLLTSESDSLDVCEGGGIVDHTYEVPSDLLEGHTQVPNIEAVNPAKGEGEGEEGERDVFSPEGNEVGYEVVTTKDGNNGAQSRVSASDVQMVLVDESTLQDCTQVQRPPHLYAVVPENVGGGEGGGGGGGGGGEGGEERSIAVPMRQPHLYEAIDTPKNQKSGQKRREAKFPQLKPKTKPPPAPPPGKKPKPAESAPNSTHQQVTSPTQEIPSANPLLGKRITVAYREGDEPGESIGGGRPLFLFPSSRRFIAVGQRDGSDSTPSPSVSCSTLSTYDDDSDAYSTEWDTSSGEEEEEQEVGPPRPKTFYIAQEVLTTERTFVKGLALLHKDFRQAMLSANRAHEKPVIAEETLKQILGNIGSLLALNAGMLQELEERMTDWDTDPRIGDILLVRAPYLKLYSEYISKFDKALKTLEEVTKRNPLFAEVLHEFEAQPKCANLPLAGYMLEIVQRIPRYKLLLSDYVKHLPEDSPDRPPSEKALEIISSVAHHVNETIRQMDNFRKVVDVRKKLIGDSGDTLITPYRKLLKEGELVKFSRKEKQPRMFFLFNDIVIYASYIPPANTTYKVIKRIPLDGMRVESLDDPDLRHGFQIISTCKSFRLEASTEDDRQQWITAFNTAIREHNERIQSRESIRRTHATDKVGDETDSVPLGHFAPPWLPDSSVSMCQLCSVQFTVTRRRHHCRGCGMIFCGECSQYLAPLRYKNNKLGRVCQTCYDKISQDDRGGGAGGEGGGGEMEADGEDKSPKRQSKLQRSQKLVRLPAVLTEVKARDQNAQISGYLMVHTSKTRRWRRKWFVVYNLVLYEFERHEDVTAKRSITLPSYQVISPVPRHDDPQVFCLRHPGAGKWYFKADREEQLERWIDVLQKAVRGETGEELSSEAAKDQNIDSQSLEHET